MRRLDWFTIKREKIRKKGIEKYRTTLVSGLHQMLFHNVVSAADQFLPETIQPLGA